MLIIYQVLSTKSERAQERLYNLFLCRKQIFYFSTINLNLCKGALRRMMILDDDKIEVRYEKVTRKERSSKQKRKTVKQKKFGFGSGQLGAQGG